MKKENFYLLLKDQFKPIVYDDYFLLMDNKYGKKYLLDKEKHQFILELTGRKTLKEIFTEYTLDSKRIILDFIKKLEKIEAVEFLAERNVIRSFNKKIVKPYLHTAILEITSRCNLNCSHCYLGDYLRRVKEKDLETVQIFRLIDDLVRMNVSEVNITGGEPLIRKDIKKIIDYLVDNKLRLGGIFTNGLLLTRKFVKYLSDLPYLTRIYVSLDGITSKSYLAIRRVKQGRPPQFSKVINAIRMCVEYNIPVSINTSVNRYNLTELRKMYEFLKRMQVDRWRLAIPRPIGRYFESSNYLSPNFQQVLEVYRYLIDKHLSEIKLTKKGEIETPINLEIEFLFNTQMVNTAINLFNSSDLTCYYDKNRCVIRANGDVVPCALLDSLVMGNIKQENIDKIWLSDRMQKIKNTRIGEIPACQSCKYLKYCGAGCRADAVRVSDNFYAKDSYLCPVMTFFEDSLFPLFKKHNFVLRRNNSSEDLLRS